MIIKEVLTKKDRKAFFEFPIKLYKNNEYFVPHPISDEEAEFSPEKNGAYAYAESKMWLCYEGKKIVGRVAAILSHAYNEKQGVKQMRFTRFDVIDDIEVSKALIGKVIEWAKEKGMNEIIGPIGFSDLDKQGMLVDGFDRLGMYITIYNHPYYVRHMEELGFKKAVDWVEYRLTVPPADSEVVTKITRLADRIAKRYGYEMVEVKGFKNMQPLVYEALSVIMNEVFAHLYGVVEINEKQIAKEAEMLKTVWVDDFVAAVKNKDGQLIGYGFMAPSVSKVMRKFKNGKLSISAILQLLRDMKNPEVVDLYNIGVKKDYQNTGVNVMIMAHCLKALDKRKVRFLETGPELETNSQVQAQWKDFEKEQHKRRRCWTLKIED